jgi:hypothetical protein
VLGRLALERAPGALEGLGDRVSVLLPWGSLLRAVAAGEPDGLRRLRAICASGARLDVAFGEDDLATASPAALEAAYAGAGLAVTARLAGAAEVAALGTTWAKRLARSDPGRRFWRLEGAAVAPAAAPEEPLRPGSAPRTAS